MQQQQELIEDEAEQEQEETEAREQARREKKEKEERERLSRQEEEARLAKDLLPGAEVSAMASVFVGATRLIYVCHPC